MCTNGVNTGQFAQMMEQIDDHVKLERKWSHNLGHMAEDAGFKDTGEKLHEVMRALDDVREMLSDAQDLLEEEANKATAKAVDVKLL